MSSSGHGDDGRDRLSVRTEGDDAGEGGSSEQFGTLIAALRSVAKEDDRAAAGLSAAGYAPLTGAQRAAIADRILLDQVSEGQAQNAPRSIGVVMSRDRRRRPGRRLFTVVLGTVAAAATLVLIARSFSDQRWAPLPAYGIAVRGGIKESRGAEPSPVPSVPGSVVPVQRLRAESRLVVTGNPTGPLEGAIAVRAFVAQGGRAEEVWPQIRIAPTGTVEIQAPVTQVFGGRTGHWDLLLLIGRPGPVRTSNASTVLTTASRPGCQAITVPLDLQTP